MKITKKILQDIIKEEISRMINEDEIPGLPTNKVINASQAIAALIDEVRRIRARLSALEGKK
tara:strand:+ start:349 stop:534 length:186 start_codon:yes stop_codon:yes gene_type:complete